jgi:hypothetical protein
LNREDGQDRKENIFCGLRVYRFCHIMRWIPSLMRVTLRFKIQSPINGLPIGERFLFSISSSRGSTGGLIC